MSQGQRDLTSYKFSKDIQGKLLLASSVVWLPLRFMFTVEGKRKKHLPEQIYNLILFFNNIRDGTLWHNPGTTAEELRNSVGSFIFWLWSVLWWQGQVERPGKGARELQRVSVSWFNFLCQLWKLDKQWQTRLFKWTCHFWFSWSTVAFFKSL